jgi:flagellin-like protein
MQTKGISPIIAAVLLIAVTMTLAGVLAFWASTFVQQGLDQSSNQTVATECNFGNFIIDACSYDAAGQRASIILNNIGTVDLRNITVYSLYPDNSLNLTSVSGDLPSNRLSSFSANGIASGFTKLRIRTHCPNVEAETFCR